MAWEVAQSGGKTYWIDWSTIEHLLYGYHRASYQIRCTKEVTLSHADKKWYNPFSWMLPDLKKLQTDHVAVRNKARFAAWQELYDLQQRVDRGGMTQVIRRVRELPQKAKQCQKVFHRKVDGAYRANIKASHRSVQQYTEAVEVARFIRNLSADTVLVMASFASGGAALAVAGAGSAGKGLGTYQDTGSVGAATIKAVGSFALAVIPIKAASSKLNTQLVLILGSGTVDAGTTYVAGGDLRKALAAGGAAMVQKSALVSGVFTKGVADNVPIPVQVIVGQGLANRSTKEAVKGALGRVLEKRGRKVQIALAENKLVRQTPDVPQLLARLAILDTDPKRGLRKQVR